MKHYLFIHWQNAYKSLIRIIRQPFSSLLSLSILSLALALPLSLYLVVMSVQEWAGKLSSIPEITLFMEMTADDTDLAAIHGALKENPRIKSYRFISKRQALKDLEKHNQMEGLTEGLGENPLPDAFVITPDTLSPKKLKLLEQELSDLPMVATAQFDFRWAQRLFEMIQLGKKIVIFLGMTLGMALILITHNTIRLQILAREEEIEVSKLIGASNHFIRQPFLYYAFWQGLLAGLAAYGLSYWLTLEANPAIDAFTSLYNEHLMIRLLHPNELCVFLAGAIILSLIGARMATNRHLRQFI